MFIKLSMYKVDKMKVLFICNQNKNRSKTAEKLFSTKFETKSAGLYNNKPITEKQLSWADLVIVMEDAQKNRNIKKIPCTVLAEKNSVIKHT